jgi:hypothetical protein
MSVAAATTHPGSVQLDGDTVSGRAYVCELLRFPDGVYEVRYLDTTPAGQ